MHISKLVTNHSLYYIYNYYYYIREWKVTTFYIYIIKYDKEDVRQADEIEENTIKEYEEYALMAFGLESKKELITSNLYKRYNKDLKHNLKT